VAGALVSPKGISKENSLYLLACHTGLARLLPRYALGSCPTVDPTSRSISPLLIRAKKSASKVDTCS